MQMRCCWLDTSYDTDHIPGVVRPESTRIVVLEPSSAD